MFTDTQLKLVCHTAITLGSMVAAVALAALHAVSGADAMIVVFAATGLGTAGGVVISTAGAAEEKPAGG